MEPGNPQPQWTPTQEPSYQSGENRGPGRPPEQSWGAAAGAYGSPQGYAPPPPAPYPPTPYGGAVDKRGRPGLIVLVAFLVELVVIAGLGNQSVSKHLSSFSSSHNTQFVGRSAGALLTYSWRFTPMRNDHFHLWLSQILAVLTVLVVTALLVLAVTRGPITFGRAFFGIWMAVVVASCLAGFVAHLVTSAYDFEPGSRFTSAVFTGPNASTFAAGVALGFVVALIASLVAISTRRSPRDPALTGAAALPYEPEPNGQQFFDQPTRRTAEPAPPRADGPSLQKDRPSEGDQATTRLPPDSRSQLPRFSEGENRQDQTTQLPRMPEHQDQTTQLPRMPEREEQTTQPPRQSGDQPTTQFPRPPDDEDLGQQPDHT
jgi:hypothetical protein